MKVRNAITVRRGLGAALGMALGLVLGSAAGSAGAEGRSVQLLEPAADTGTIQLDAAGNTQGMIKRLELESGSSVFVRTGYAVKRVSVGNPGLLDVVVLNPRELQFVATGAGSTNVLVWDAQGLPQASIEVRIGSPSSYLEGVLQDLSGNPDIRVTSAQNSVILTGAVPTELAAEQAVQVAEAFVGDEKTKGRAETTVVNALQVGGNHQVMLKVVVAEMSRTITREMGTNFTALIDAGNGQVGIAGLLNNLTSQTLSAGAGSVGSSDVGFGDMINLAAAFSGFGNLELLAVFLDILDERGLTKVLAEPTLVARSGETASFLVGGEIPIPVAQGGAFGSITIEYKDFGVILNFTPTVLGPDRIHLKVNPEVSQPDFTFGTQFSGIAIPAFNTRRAATSVELKHGQSLAIAGLLAEDIRSQTSQYPLLGQIPILGNLFRSSQFEKNETELVIIVTPVLANPLGPGPHSLPTDYYVEPTALEFYVFGELEGLRKPEPKSEEPAGLIGAAGYRVSPTVKENE